MTNTAKNRALRYTLTTIITLVLFLIIGATTARAMTKSEIKSTIEAGINQAISDYKSNNYDYFSYKEVGIDVSLVVSLDENEAKAEIADYFEREIYPIVNSTLSDKGYIYQYGLNYVYSYYPGENIVNYKFYIYPSQLFRAEKVKNAAQFYRKTLELMKKMDYKTWIYCTDDSIDIGDLMHIICEQHPEYYGGGWTTKYSGDSLVVKLTGPESNSKLFTKTKMKKADQKADEIIKKIIKKGMSTDQKIKAIHDYLATHCNYDSKSAASDSMTQAHTAYGCLVNKKAVCQGYAAAFNLLLTKCKIPSIAVSGYGNGGSHAWNLVKVGSKAYYYDVTWDDPVFTSGPKPDFVRWDYYKLTASQIGKNHSWDKHMFASKYLKYVDVLF